MITIKDIAARLKVANSTVGRALADDPRVSEKTKMRVRAVAQEMGYITNVGAQIMRGRQSSLLGLIIPDIENDFYATMAKSLAEQCNQQGFQLVLSVTEDNAITESQHVRALVSARAAGVIIVPTRSTLPETATMLKLLPVMQLIRTSSAIESDSFTIDDARGTFDATVHLLSLGHRQIAYIGAHAELSTGSARLNGYLRAMKESDLKPAKELIWTGPPRALDGFNAFHSLYKRWHPTAVIAGGARLSLGILEAAQDMGLTAPDDISMIGFGDSPWLKWWGRGLTTIGLPIKEITSAAGAALFDRLKTKSLPRKSPPFNSVHHPNLIVRRSTDVYIDKNQNEARLAAR